MANRKVGRGRNGTRPESTPESGAGTEPGSDGRKDTTTGPEAETPALDTPPAPATGAGEVSDSEGAADKRIPAEDMPPLIAEQVGPAADPAAAAEPGTVSGTSDPGVADGASDAEANNRQDAASVAPAGADGEDSAKEGAEPGADPLARSPETEPPAATAWRSSDDQATASTAGAMAAERGSERVSRPADEPGHRRGRSAAAVVLFALLLLIAGAALGIWAGPRIAPHLPAGMAPVAEWLSPRDPEADARLAALESDMAAELDALRARIEAAVAESADDEIGTRLAELEERLEARMESLAAEVQSLDGSETRQRLSQLETALEGERETLASLSEQLSAATGSASAEIDTYQAALAGLRGEVQETVAQVAALSRRIDEVAAQAAQQVELARSRVAEIEKETAAELDQAEIEAALAEIRSALASGVPFNDAAGRLAEGPGVPAGLLNAASEGVPSIQTLRERFPEAANAAIQASVRSRSADGDVLDRLGGFFRSQIASRSLEPREGNDTDAILSRMEAALSDNALEPALAEAEALPPEAAEAMSDWLAAARARHDAVTSFETLQAELSATN